MPTTLTEKVAQLIAEAKATEDEAIYPAEEDYASAQAVVSGLGLSSKSYGKTMIIQGAIVSD